MNWTTKATMAALATAMLICGCAQQANKEGQFGDTVHHMTELQIYNLDAAHNPDPQPPMGGDPDRLNDVLDSHRNNAEDPTEDRGALTIDNF